MKPGDIFRVVKGGGPNYLRVGQLWELTESVHMGVQFTKDAKRNGLKHGMSTMILNGYTVAQSELRAGRIVYATPEAAPLPHKKTAALLEAGEVIDEAMMQLLTTDFVLCSPMRRLWTSYTAL